MAFRTGKNKVKFEEMKIKVTDLDLLKHYL